MSMHETQSLIT